LISFVGFPIKNPIVYAGKDVPASVLLASGVSPERLITECSAFSHKFLTATIATPIGWSTATSKVQSAAMQDWLPFDQISCSLLLSFKEVASDTFNSGKSIVLLRSTGLTIPIFLLASFGINNNQISYN
jgi:hypothetical protein